MAHEKTSLIHWIVLLAAEQFRDHQKAHHVATIGDFPGVDAAKLVDRLYTSGLILRRYETSVVTRHLHDLAVPGRLIQAQSFDRSQPTRYVPTPYASRLYDQIAADNLVSYALSRDGRKNLTEILLWASYHAKPADRTRSTDDLVRDCALPGVDRLQAALDRLKRGVRIPLSTEEGGLKLIRLSSREVSPGMIQLWVRDGEPPARSSHTEGVDFALPSNDGLIQAAEQIASGSAQSRPSALPDVLPVTKASTQEAPQNGALAGASMPEEEEKFDVMQEDSQFPPGPTEYVENSDAPSRGTFEIAQLPPDVYAFLLRSARRHGHTVQDEIRIVLCGQQRRSDVRNQLMSAITALLMEEFG